MRIKSKRNIQLLVPKYLHKCFDAVFNFFLFCKTNVLCLNGELFFSFIYLWIFFSAFMNSALQNQMYGLPILLSELTSLKHNDTYLPICLSIYHIKSNHFVIFMLIAELPMDNSKLLKITGLMFFPTYPKSLKNFCSFLRKYSTDAIYQVEKVLLKKVL